MSYKIYFYTLSQSTADKFNKVRVYCKISVPKSKAISFPLKPSEGFDTLLCKKVDLISKHNQYVCVDVDKASIINLTIIQYRDSIVRGIRQLATLNYPISKELILPFLFATNKSQEQEPVMYDDLPDIVTGNIDSEDIEKGYIDPNDVFYPDA